MCWLQVRLPSMLSQQAPTHAPGVGRNLDGQGEGVPHLVFHHILLRRREIGRLALNDGAALGQGQAWFVSKCGVWMWVWV